MPLTQQQVADHLDLHVSQVSRWLGQFGMTVEANSLDEIRIRYIQQLRGSAARQRADDGTDLVKERVLSERVDRQLKEIQIAEKLSVLVNVAELEAAYRQMVASFAVQLQSRDDALVDELRALYGHDIDRDLVARHTRDALEQLARYDPGSAGGDPTDSGDVETAGEDRDDGMGAEIPAPVQ